MPTEERNRILQQIQSNRGSKVLAYFLGDRETKPRGMTPPSGLRQNIEQDAKWVIYETLRRIGPQNKIDLFLYTRGGDTNAIWPIVSIIREFCHEFNVLVPFKAHSGGTMICLGADKIIMGKMGELSPIDPTTGNPFNPPDEIIKGARKGISVEDLTSYLALAKDEKKFGIKDDKDIMEVFKELTKNVHPLALGNVNRVHTQIRLLAEKLLSIHLDPETEYEKIKRITDTLTEKFYSHLHFINRKEAQEILGEDIVAFSGDEMEELMRALFESYASIFQLHQDFCYNEVLGNNQQIKIKLLSGIIECEETSFTYETDLQLFQRTELPPNIQIQLRPDQVVTPIIQGLPKTFHWEVVSEGWRLNRGEG